MEGWERGWKQDRRLKESSHSFNPAYYHILFLDISYRLISHTCTLSFATYTPSKRKIKNSHLKKSNAATECQHSKRHLFVGHLTEKTDSLPKWGPSTEKTRLFVSSFLRFHTYMSKTTRHHNTFDKCFQHKKGNQTGWKREAIEGRDSAGQRTTHQKANILRLKNCAHERKTGHYKKE